MKEDGREEGCGSMVGVSQSADEEADGLEWSRLELNTRERVTASRCCGWRRWALGMAI